MAHKKPAYDAETIATFRAWTKDCRTWDEARDLISKNLGAHPDNVTRNHQQYCFWEGRDPSPGEAAAPQEHGSAQVSEPQPLHPGEFDVEIITSKEATLDELERLSKTNLDGFKVTSLGMTRCKAHYGLSVRFGANPEVVNRQLVEELKADFLAAPRVAEPVTPRKPAAGGRLLVVSLFDAHLGKLSWAEQDGQNYDLKIARECYLRALYDLVAKAQKQGAIGRILFPVGNDYMTCDTDTNETTAGTLQSVDGRFPKIYREARKLLVEAINYLRNIAPVDVYVIPGNHERNSMFHLGDALECWFHGDAEVTVDNTWTVRKYFRFGETVFGLTHGDTIKQEKLPLLGAVERPDLWAACKRRVWLLGHHHHYQVNEYDGVQVWILPSLSGSDGYHQMNGYIGSTRCAVAFLHSANELEATFHSSPEN